MSHWKRLLAVLAVVGLAVSCGGGGGDAGTPPFGDNGGGTTGAAKAADLMLTLSSGRILNGASDTITATAIAVDSKNNVVSGIPVSLAVDAGATIKPSGTTTDDSGVVTGVVGMGSDKSNRSVTVTATSGNLKRTAVFVVTGATLSVNATPLVNAGSANNVIQYTLLDSNSVAMPNQAYTVSGTGLAAQNGQTDQFGKFNYSYTAPATQGDIVITATAAGVSLDQSITVSSGSVQEAVGGPIVSASITPTPSVVAANTAGSMTNQVELRALFVGPDNRPIPNVRARFDAVNKDKDSVKDPFGSVNMVADYAYSDANGIARATYVPGTGQSPTNGVKVRVCFDTKDFTSKAKNDCDDVEDPKKVRFAYLTVVQGGIAVNITTNNIIGSGGASGNNLGDLTFIREYAVMVVNAAGQAMSNVTITPSVDLTDYRKGFYAWSDAASAWVQTVTATCSNEDVNSNGVLEDGEDINGNNRLDPVKSDVSTKNVPNANGSVTTNANGIAVVQIEYGKSVATWVKYDLKVTASVTGTEGVAHFSGWLDISGSELTNKNVSPSAAWHTYGDATVCTKVNHQADPDR
jgi:hypothetical protein